eukprot:gene4503-2914_t
MDARSDVAPLMGHVEGGSSVWDTLKAAAPYGTRGRRQPRIWGGRNPLSGIAGYFDYSSTQTAQR